VKDYLVRIVTKTENIRALACVTTGLVNKARKRHGTFPAASAALGRALTGGALLGALTKTGQRVGLKFEGNGPLRKIIVEADSNGAVRGYVGVPEVHMVTAEGKLDVGGALGRAGFLTVTRDLGLKEPYRGTVRLYTSEIAEDIAYYLTDSEQIPSAVGLGVFVETDNSVSASGGFLVQSLPPADEHIIDVLMERIGRMPTITRFLLGGGTPEGLLESLFADIPFVTLEKRELAFLCTCTREKIEQVLISLGSRELSDMLDREGKAEVTCEFCREVYHFSRMDLERLLGEIESMK
jgi:molecular chaperone Hsp33